jgi:arginine utilization protein RocB
VNQGNFSLESLCRDLALRLTERPSVTGTPDEGTFGPWLAGVLSGLGHWGEAAEVWTLPVAPGDPRHCVLMLLRKSGPETVILTGHYDTVTVADYGDLAPLATSPRRRASRRSSLPRPQRPRAPPMARAPGRFRRWATGFPAALYFYMKRPWGGRAPRASQP